MPLGSRHGHIKKPPLFLQFIVGKKGIGGRKPAVDHPDHKDTLPLQPLRGMNRREYEPFIIAIGRYREKRAAVRGGAAPAAGALHA